MNILLIALLNSFTQTAYGGKLSVASVACDEDLPINVQYTAFHCENRCGFGKDGNISSSLSYYNVSSLNVYLESTLKFEAWANNTFKQLAGGSNIVEKLKYTEVLDLCSGDESCSNDGGEFEMVYEYGIPSTGNMDKFFEGFNVTSRFLYYDAQYGNLMGDCLFQYTTKSLAKKYSGGEQDLSDEYVDYDDSSSSSNVYQNIAANAGWYTQCFFYAAAAFIGVYSGFAMYRKSGECRKIEMQEEERTDYLLATDSGSLSCNSDDVERLQKDIQNRIHVFKEKIPWPQPESVKLVHEESIPWPDESVMTSNMEDGVNEQFDDNEDEEDEQELPSSPTKKKKKKKSSTENKFRKVMNAISESKSGSDEEKKHKKKKSSKKEVRERVAQSNNHFPGS